MLLNREGFSCGFGSSAVTVINDDQRGGLGLGTNHMRHALVWANFELDNLGRKQRHE